MVTCWRHPMRTMGRYLGTFQLLVALAITVLLYVHLTPEYADVTSWTGTSGTVDSRRLPSDTAAAAGAAPNNRPSLTVNFDTIRTEYGAQIFNVTNADHLEIYQHLTPKIPHIIHQTWSSNMVPLMFKDWIQSIMDLHPNWEYYFWTDKDVECLLKQKYPPEHLANFKNYPDGIFRGDALRYYILYEFGGIYLDLDNIALKPLDYWTYTHQAFMSHENYEHAYLRIALTKPFLINSVMGARAKHPYFRMLVDNLILYKDDHSDSHRHVLFATGPFFATAVWEKLRNATQAEDAAVTVLHPRYFLPMFDPIHPKYDIACQTTNEKGFPHKYQVCQQLKARNFSNVVSPDSFFNHQWAHTNLVQFRDSVFARQFFNIYEAFPKSRRLSQVLKCN